MHNMANNHKAHVIKFEGCDKFDNGASDEEPNYNAIKLPMLKLMIPRIMNSTWARR